MKFFKFLQEALKPSQYRQYVKNWDKTKYEKIFNGKYRIYLEINKVKEDLRANPEIERKLSDLGYEVENYAAGLAKKKGGKNPIRIGRLLKNDPELLKVFTNDPIRSTAKQSDLMVVISRHPYDIAGMSTDRGWYSCMNLDNGSNRHYVMGDIKEGTIVAYFINKNDKNINNPKSRLLIKPFVNVNDPKDILLVPDVNMYGSSSSKLRKTVEKWLDSFQSSKVGMFELSKNCYSEFPARVVNRNLIPLKEKYLWLANADIGDFSDVIEKDGKVVWLTGLWSRGSWKGDVWESGIWEDGTWWGGVWKYGVWKYGVWKFGRWENGRWKDGQWEGGIWKNGLWHGGTWENGTREDGLWWGGVWKYGVWKDGQWERGIWKNGTWKKGKIWSAKFTAEIESINDPTKFKELEAKANTIKELREMAMSK